MPSNDDTHRSEMELYKTEERILQAAIRVFSRRPVSEATIRMVAQEAGLIHTIIVYHYKNKDRLYQAVFDRVMGGLTRFYESWYDEVKKKKKIERDEAKKILVEFTGHIMDLFYGSSPVSGSNKIILFEMYYPSKFTDYFYEKHYKRIYEIWSDLVMIATGKRNVVNATFLVVNIFGLLSSFRMEREMMTKHIGLVGFSKEETEKMKKMVVKNMLLLIDGNS